VASVRVSHILTSAADLHVKVRIKSDKRSHMLNGTTSPQTRRMNMRLLTQRRYQPITIRNSSTP